MISNISNKTWQVDDRHYKCEITNKSALKTSDLRTTAISIDLFSKKDGATEGKKNGSTPSGI